MRDLPPTRACFVCGCENPIGMRLKIRTDGKEVRAEFTPRREHAGFKDVVHGGLITTVLDELMAWACIVSAGKLCYCAELTVRFRRPLDPGTTATGTARLDADRGGKVLLVSAELKNSAGHEIAAATGKFMPAPEAEAERFRTEFLGRIEDLLPPADDGR